MQPLTRAQQFWLAVFLTVWCFAGLTGRDAWRPEEALALAPLLDWRAAGALLPPHSTFPFYTLLTGLTSWLSQSWLDVQDGARLASGLLTLVALSFTGLTARALFGPGYGAAAALALLGCFGLMLRAHALLPETALLAGYAMLIYGVVLARTRVFTGAAMLASASFVLILCRGLPDLIAALLIISLPMISRDWRERTYRRAVVYGLIGLAALTTFWLLLLWSQDLLAARWAQFFALAMPRRNPGALLELLTWFAWPVWPLALWTLWHEHRRLKKEVVLHPVLAATVVTLLLGHWTSYSPGGSALPILIPLALIAAHGVATMKRGGAQGFYWFGVLCFLFFTTAFWIYFAGMEWGWPVNAGNQMARLVPGFSSGATETFALFGALAGTLLWLIALPLFPRAKTRPILVWATGMALTWLLLMTLFKPWAEAGWGYKPQIRAMAAHLPDDACLRADVDPAMTVMLRLYLADRYQTEGQCAWWLVGGVRADFAADDWGLNAVWTGGRPRDKKHYYALVKVD
jgi:hypothetical protein